MPAARARRHHRPITVPRQPVQRVVCLGGRAPEGRVAVHRRAQRKTRSHPAPNAEWDRRTGRDSNPRYAFDVNTLSRRAGKHRDHDITSGFQRADIAIRRGLAAQVSLVSDINGHHNGHHLRAASRAVCREPLASPQLSPACPMLFRFVSDSSTWEVVRRAAASPAHDP